MNGDHTRRRAALEVTVARMNAERVAIGLPADYTVAFNTDGVPYLGVKVERVHLDPATIKRVRL